MALAHDGYNFGNYTNGEMILTPFDLPIKIGRFPGVTGEVHLIDQRKGRHISCQYILTGLASLSALEAAVAALHAKAGTLTGTLSVSGTFAIPDLPNCTFLGFRPTDIPRPDGFGTYLQYGRLEWIQRSP